MDKKQFQNIIQYCGTGLINYILNPDVEILRNTDFDKLNLSKEQTSVLDDLYQKITQCRIQFVMQGGYGDGVDFYLRSLRAGKNSLFNTYREICGGGFPVIKTEDKILSFLSDICIREYPNLLVKSSTPSHHQYLNSNIGIGDYEEFIKLVKADPLDGITNKLEGLEYAFTFTTTDGLEFYTQVCTACGIIVSRAFQNACNKMSYDLESLLVELEESLNSLRKLSEGEEIIYSTFVGIKGLNFDGFDCLDLGGATLRQIDDISNPSPHTNSIIVQHTVDGGQYYSGHVFEILHKLAIRESTATKSYTMNRAVYDEQDRLIDSFKFAVIFTLLEDRGISTGFSESGFPLIQPGNYSNGDRRPLKYLTINAKDAEDVSSWFSCLSETDLSHVQVPLKRLKYAIFERHQSEDSIVDAIISWEGMFSEAFETTFKVTGSISKYLSDKESREEFLSRLKKLYGLRSDLVHGKKSNLMEKEDIEELRSEVIKIGLNCLKKLLKDEGLLKMSPQDRVKQIMVMD
ncbi:hypothetical protein [Pseudoalteromonas xiamenensis]